MGHPTSVYSYHGGPPSQFRSQPPTYQDVAAAAVAPPQQKGTRREHSLSSCL